MAPEKAVNGSPGTVGALPERTVPVGEAVVGADEAGTPDAGASGPGGGAHETTPKRATPATIDLNACSLPTLRNCSRRHRINKLTAMMPIPTSTQSVAVVLRPDSSAKGISSWNEMNTMIPAMAAFVRP